VENAVMRNRIVLWIAALALSILSIPLSAQEEPGQVLGMAMNPRMIPTPELSDYLNGFVLAHNAGVNGNAYTETWSAFEPAAGAFALDQYVTDMNGYLRFYPDTVLLGIQVLNTTDKETPPDLLDVPFDDPRMLERFKALIDAMLPQLNQRVLYLSIGNEVDVYLSTHDEWDAYTVFYDGAVEYVHQVAPQLQVGVTVTYGGLRDFPAQVERLNERSDVVILTYYPLGAAFTADDPDAPLIDFPKMVEASGGRPVILQEVGYPSAELLDGSEPEQAQFVRSVFAAWAAAGNAIPFLDFFLLHDLTEDFCDELEVYYGLEHPNFHAYLCTLGLRRADGTPKLAWDTFVEEAARWREGS
jgi:hypothetical protein